MLVIFKLLTIAYVAVFNVIKLIVLSIIPHTAMNPYYIRHHGSDIYLGMSLIQNGDSYLMYRILNISLKNFSGI